MKEQIESSFRDLIACLQVVRLYSLEHPQFKKSLEKAYSSLQEVLTEHNDFVIGIVGEELAFEKEIFFELSKTIKPTIQYLKDRGIERIQFLRGLDREELSRFISFLIAPKEELGPDAQAALSFFGIKNILVGKIKASVSVEDEVAKSVNFLSTYEDSLNKVTRSLEKVLNQEELDHLNLKITVTSVMENLLMRYPDLLNFATMKRYDVKTFAHMLNVSVLAMYFSSKIGLSKEQILDIGTAALFHDIGKLYISRKIIQKPDKLSEEEFGKIKNHVIVGTEILLRYVDTLGILPAVVCFEHHLKYNLSGYPKVSSYKKLHISSLMVCICDFYDALSSRRSYKNDYPPEMIYRLMVKEKGTTFDPPLLDKFFQIMGAWPIGTVIVLSDGRVAVVKGENEDDIFSPNIEVVAPEDKKENIDLRTARGKLQIQRSLNPMKEGKEFLPF